MHLPTPSTTSSWGICDKAWRVWIEQCSSLSFSPTSFRLYFLIFFTAWTFLNYPLVTKRSTLNKHGYLSKSFVPAMQLWKFFFSRRTESEKKGRIIFSGSIDPKHIKNQVLWQQKTLGETKRQSSVPSICYLAVFKSFRELHNRSCTNPRSIISRYRLTVVGVSLLDTRFAVCPRSGEVTLHSLPLSTQSLDVIGRDVTVEGEPSGG